MPERIGTSEHADLPIALVSREESAQKFKSHHDVIFAKDSARDDFVNFDWHAELFRSSNLRDQFCELKIDFEVYVRHTFEFFGE